MALEKQSSSNPLVNADFVEIDLGFSLPPSEYNLIHAKSIGYRGRAEEVKAGAIQSTVGVTVEIDGRDRPACVVKPISRYMPA